MSKKFLNTLLLASVTALAGMYSSAASAKYPQAPVTFIVPGPAGSGTDSIGRLLADEFSKMWGQAVVVENRAGASGMIGTQMVLRGDPNGYTILLGHVSTHSIVPALRQPAPYHPVADFEAVGKSAPLRTYWSLRAIQA